MNPPDERQRELLRLIPQVNVLADFAKESVGPQTPRGVLLSAAKTVSEEARASIVAGVATFSSPDALSLEALARMVIEEVALVMEPSFRKVINATGVVLHTNIGRSPLSERALAAVRDVCEGYSNLELRVETAERGSRQEHLEPLLTRLTGAEAALVVNNNAAAVLLALAALARDREVIVSRGQLVEIGDSFRLPDIMRQSGAILVEVGTTNITVVGDYAGAVGPDTALLLRVHQSNFRIVGYSREVPLGELVELGRHHSIPVVEDLGSGSLAELAGHGLAGEHTAIESVAAGADLVTFSGDKLLGGPQAGIIVGSSSYIEALRRHPLTRALRIDKMTVAALEATLIEYLEPSSALKNIPALRIMLEPPETVKRRAARLKRAVDAVGSADVEAGVASDFSRAGGGTLPTAEIPTYCLRVAHARLTASELEERLREASPPVIARVNEDRLVLDLRTVADTEIPVLGRILKTVLEQ